MTKFLVLVFSLLIAQPLTAQEFPVDEELRQQAWDAAEKKEFEKFPAFSHSRTQL